MSLFRSKRELKPSKIQPKPAQPVITNGRRRVWEDFRNDRQTLELLRVTPEEVARLQTVFMLSRFTERSQLLEALNRLRWRP